MTLSPEWRAAKLRAASTWTSSLFVNHARVVSTTTARRSAWARRRSASHVSVMPSLREIFSRASREMGR